MEGGEEAGQRGGQSGGCGRGDEGVDAVPDRGGEEDGTDGDADQHGVEPVDAVGDLCGGGAQCPGRHDAHHAAARREQEDAHSGAGQADEHDESDVPLVHEEDLRHVGEEGVPDVAPGEPGVPVGGVGGGLRAAVPDPEEGGRTEHHDPGDQAEGRGEPGQPVRREEGGQGGGEDRTHDGADDGQHEGGRVGVQVGDQCDTGEAAGEPLEAERDVRPVHLQRVGGGRGDHGAQRREEADLPAGAPQRGEDEDARPQDGLEIHLAHSADRCQEEARRLFPLQPSDDVRFGDGHG